MEIKELENTENYNYFKSNEVKDISYNITKEKKKENTCISEYKSKRT